MGSRGPYSQVVVGVGGGPPARCTQEAGGSRSHCDHHGALHSAGPGAARNSSLHSWPPREVTQDGARKCLMGTFTAGQTDEPLVREGVWVPRGVAPWLSCSEQSGLRERSMAQGFPGEVGGSFPRVGAALLLSQASGPRGASGRSPGRPRDGGGRGLEDRRVCDKDGWDSEDGHLEDAGF